MAASFDIEVVVRIRQKFGLRTEKSIIQSRKLDEIFMVLEPESGSTQQWQGRLERRLRETWSDVRVEVYPSRTFPNDPGQLGLFFKAPHDATDKLDQTIAVIALTCRVAQEILHL